MSTASSNSGCQTDGYNQSLRPSPEDYTVGWLCAVPIELKAARAMLDVEHAPLQCQPKADANSYILGSMSHHNVILACLPEYGTNQASRAAQSMLSTFPNVRFGLMVGLGGGVPDEHDIRLGDLVISKPTERGGGVIQYDLGRREQDGFHRLGTLNKPPRLLNNAVINLMTARSPGETISQLVKKAFQDDQDDEFEGSWEYPGATKDNLFQPGYPHIEDQPNCNKCVKEASSADLVSRADRPSIRPRIHYGNIGSGNSVIKNASDRVQLAKRDNVICFEMEAAGLMDDFPCLVIRGICDYADSHKNNLWQQYAAAVAAGYARTLLTKIPSADVQNLEPVNKHPPQPLQLGPVTYSGMSNIDLVINNYDFSLFKLPAPDEFHILGQTLTTTRREQAEDGKLHTTARRLAALFEPLLPKTPTLIRCYGLRSSEIAEGCKEDLKPNFAIFSEHAGIDGTSIWAGATSGESAVQVHLLACLLARFWTSSEATSVWSELLTCRRQEIQQEFDQRGTIPIDLMLAAKHQVEREQLAEWDSSARAWLRMADSAKQLEQSRVRHAVGSENRMVNSKPTMFESVIRTWKAGLEGMEALLKGLPLATEDGNLLPALSSWHLYPDLNILGVIQRQRDRLVPASGILTINSSSGLHQHEGLHWSLPLAQIRYYGGPETRTSLIAPQGSRLSLEEFNIAMLGCVLGGWKPQDDEVESVIRWIQDLSITLLAYFDKKKSRVKESWLQVLGCAAERYLKSEDTQRRLFRPVLKCGRGYPLFIGKPTLPFFGLCAANRALSLTKNTEQKIKVLRSQAFLAGFHESRAIIRYISEETGQEEYASAVPQKRKVPKRTESGFAKSNNGHVRWVHPRVQSGQEASNEPFQEDINLDFFTIPSTEPQLSTTVPEPQGDSMPTEIERAIARQHQKFTDLGEELRYTDSEKLKTISRPGGSMRVTWGYLDGPWAANTNDFEPPSFGQWNHYRYWLGDPMSVAMFVRMDEEDPEEHPVPFKELQGVFRKDVFDNSALPLAFAEAVQTSQMEKYFDSLRAIATINLLYDNLKQATIDVRVLERSLAHTNWFKALSEECGAGDEPESPPATEDIRVDSENSAFDTHYVPTGYYRGFSPHAFEDAIATSPPKPPPPAAPLKSMPITEALKITSETVEPWIMSTMTSFSCILLLENTFDIVPSQLRDVMAISTCDSLFVATSVCSDPATPRRRVQIERVIGNIGRPGTALLVPTRYPRRRDVGLDHFRETPMDPWDGVTKHSSSFQASNLHLWFTGSTQDVDHGDSSLRDRELYILESVVSLYHKGTWMADLDILKALHNPVVYRHKHAEALFHGRTRASTAVTCTLGHEKKYFPEKFPLAAISNWLELLKDIDENCIFLAPGNWQARLAAMMICLAKDIQIHLLPESVCWTCILSAQALQSESRVYKIYIS